jgi:hypothetical protein
LSQSLNNKPKLKMSKKNRKSNKLKSVWDNNPILDRTVFRNYKPKAPRGRALEGPSTPPEKVPEGAIRVPSYEGKNTTSFIQNFRKWLQVNEPDLRAGKRVVMPEGNQITGDELQPIQPGDVGSPEWVNNAIDTFLKDPSIAKDRNIVKFERAFNKPVSTTPTTPTQPQQDVVTAQPDVVTPQVDQPLTPQQQPTLDAVDVTPDQASTPQRFGASGDASIQGPEMPQSTSTDVGRDAAQQILDDRLGRQQIDTTGGSATTNKQLLAEMQQRQQSLQQNAQAQIRGDQPTPTWQDNLNSLYVDSGLMSPDVAQQAKNSRNKNSGITGTRGSIRYQPPSRRATAIDAAIGVAVDLAGHYIEEPASKFWYENMYRPVMGAFGVETSNYSVAKADKDYREQLPEQDRFYQDQYNQRVEEGNAPIEEGEAPAAPTLPPAPGEDDGVVARNPFTGRVNAQGYDANGVFVGVPEAQTPAPQQPRQLPQPPESGISQNRGSIRFTQQLQSLPTPPPLSTKEQVINRKYDELRASDPEAAVAYGKEQHKELFPHLYND